MKSGLIIIFLLLPFVSLAGGDTGFVPLVGIPGIQGGDFNSYVNALYGLAISIAALIAVVKIVLAGAKYMMDDIVTHKSEAKEDIKNSLIGLLIIIGAVIILTTVNSDLTNLSINADNIELDNSSNPIQVLNDFEKKCTEARAAGSSCSTIPCDAAAWRFVPIAGSCEQKCEAVNGIFDKSGWPKYGNCYVSNKEVGDVINAELSETVNTNCPDGVTGCYAELCNTYGDSDSSLDWNSCSDYCLEVRDGVYYDEATTACVFAGNTESELIACEEVTQTNEYGTETNTSYSCGAAQNECLEKGGEYSGGGANINCTFRINEIPESIKQSVCVSGYECTVQRCEATGMLNFCSSWCANNGNMDYSSEFNVCYKNVANEGVSNNYQSSINYLINDPGAPNHNRPITDFYTVIEPVTIQEGQIRILRKDGIETWAGCDTINPNPC